MDDVIEKRRHLAKMLGGEERVEHLALFLVARSVCRQKTRSEGELDETVQSAQSAYDTLSE